LAQAAGGRTARTESTFNTTQDRHEATVRSKAREQANWSAPIVMQIEPAETFYEAED